MKIRLLPAVCALVLALAGTALAQTDTLYVTNGDSSRLAIVSGQAKAPDANSAPQLFDVRPVTFSDCRSAPALEY